MPFRCILSPTAEEDFVKLPKAIRDYIAEHLRLLAESPTTVSIPSHFPYPPSCQLYHLPPFHLNEKRYDLIILFKYGQDEESLQIAGIGYSISSD